MSTSCSSSSSLIGVTGASGKLGGSVIRQLLTASVSPSRIIALIRTPNSEKGKALTAQGVVVRELDYNNPTTIQTALKGVNSLLFVSPNDLSVHLVQVKNVLKGAVAAGVTRVVYYSMLHADIGSTKLPAVETEEEIKKAFPRFTLLRNGWYTDNYIGSILGALAQGEFVGAAGDGKISAATIDDFAAAAVSVLTAADPSPHDGKTYELAGDTAFTYTELAAEISKLSGKHIPYKNLSVMEYVGVLTSIGVPALEAELIAEAEAASAKGSLFDNSGQLAKLIGRPTTPWTVTVKNIVASAQQ